jgi:hypothetical protein
MGDLHSAKIEQNKLGILRGADINLRLNVIDKNQHQDINSTVALAPILDFRPLLLVIPFKSVAKRLKQVAIKNRANPLSEEYIIEDLSRKTFDVIEFR